MVMMVHQVGDTESYLAIGGKDDAFSYQIPMVDVMCRHVRHNLKGWS